MGKRFIDTTIWDRPWFMELSPEDKMAVMYLFCKCDSVGVWVPNYKLANFQIGSDIEWDTLAKKCNGNIRVLDNGKWFLVDFCKFQYGDLVETNNAHRSYIALLRKHELLSGAGEGLPSPCQAPQEKEKEKEINLKSEKAPEPYLDPNDNKWVNVTDDDVALWEKAYPACDIERELAKMAAWIIANPEKRKTKWRRFITNWLSRCQNNGGTR